MAPPNRPPPRTLEVIASRRVTPNMLRVTLGGPGLAGFPEGQAGGYVKLRLPAAGEADRRIVRTYTIRHQRNGEIDVDFALHGNGGMPSGPATDWALGAKAGDTIEVGGPGAPSRCRQVPVSTGCRRHDCAAGDQRQSRTARP